MRNAAAAKGLANSDLMRLSRNTPSTAAGSVPVIRSIARRSASELMLPRIAAVKKPRMIDAHCVRYRTSSAVAVPMWSSTRNGTKDESDCLKLQCRRLGTSTACPSDETGNSSVAPWSRPMNSACKSVTWIYS